MLGGTARLQNGELVWVQLLCMTILAKATITTDPVTVIFSAKGRSRELHEVWTNSILPLPSSSCNERVTGLFR